MKNIIWILGVLFLLSCTDNKKAETNNKSQVEVENPVKENLEDEWVPDEYKTSELAELMRNLFDDHLIVKAHIEENRLDSISAIQFRNIHKARPTDPGDDTPLFHTYADAFLFSDSILFTSTSQQEYKSNFNTMVNNCISCHKNFCMGPIAKIEKLRIK